MAHDLSGAWNTVPVIDPLQKYHKELDIQNAIRYWLSLGASNLNIGIPLYGNSIDMNSLWQKTVDLMNTKTGIQKPNPFGIMESLEVII
jgi:hypothetical protein